MMCERNAFVNGNQINEHVLMIAPYEDDLVLLHQLQDELLKKPGLGPPVKEVSQDNQLVGLLVSKIAGLCKSLA